MARHRTLHVSLETDVNTRHVYIHTYVALSYVCNFSLTIRFLPYIGHGRTSTTALQCHRGIVIDAVKKSGVALDYNFFDLQSEQSDFLTHFSSRPFSKTKIRYSWKDVTKRRSSFV